jgi:hypothetical protein
MKRMGGETCEDRNVAKRSNREQILKEAWIGDAVLTLYARERILREQDAIDAQTCERMTSNQFLTAIGEPSEVEAEIGRVYQREGLAGSYEWIEARLMLTFARQQENRLRKLGVSVHKPAVK